MSGSKSSLRSNIQTNLNVLDSPNFSNKMTCIPCKLCNPSYCESTGNTPAIIISVYNYISRNLMRLNVIHYFIGYFTTLLSLLAVINTISILFQSTVDVPFLMAARMWEIFPADISVFYETLADLFINYSIYLIAFWNIRFFLYNYLSFEGSKEGTLHTYLK